MDTVANQREPNKGLAEVEQGGVLQAALAYVRAGLSVIPILADGSKAPEGRLLPKLPKGPNGKLVASWDPYKERLPTEAELQRWFQNGRLGLAVIGGRVSGGLECADFDR